MGDWGPIGPPVETTLAVYPPIGNARPSLPQPANEAIPTIAAGLLEVRPFEYLIDIWAGFGAKVVLAETAATIVAVEEDPPAGAGSPTWPGWTA